MRSRRRGRVSWSLDIGIAQASIVQDELRFTIAPEYGRYAAEHGPAVFKGTAFQYSGRRHTALLGRSMCGMKGFLEIDSLFCGVSGCKLQTRVFCKDN